MSQWTHVNASIRYDSLFGIGAPTEELLGQICRWGDDNDSHWTNPDLPCGSEGSIHYEIIRTGSENSLASHAVIFTGDLRDYDDVEEILTYFTRICTEEGYMIRSGVLAIDVECKASFVYRFDGKDKKEWIKCAEIIN